MRRSQPDDMARNAGHRPGRDRTRRATNRSGMGLIRAPRRFMVVSPLTLERPSAAAVPYRREVDGRMQAPAEILSNDSGGSQAGDVLGVVADVVQHGIGVGTECWRSLPRHRFAGKAERRGDHAESIGYDRTTRDPFADLTNGRAQCLGHVVDGRRGDFAGELRRATPRVVRAHRASSSRRVSSARFSRRSRNVANRGSSDQVAGRVWRTARARIYACCT